MFIPFPLLEWHQFQYTRLLVTWGLHSRFACKAGLEEIEKFRLEHEEGSLDAKCITDFSPDINLKNIT